MDVCVCVWVDKEGGGCVDVVCVCVCGGVDKEGGLCGCVCVCGRGVDKEGGCVDVCVWGVRGVGGGGVWMWLCL